MKPGRFFLFYFLLFLATGQGIAVAEEAPRIEASLDRTQITIGDRLKLTLAVEAPTGSQVDMTDLKRHLGDLVVKEFGKEGPTPLAGERVRHTVWILLTAYATGKFDISPIPVKVRSPSGDETTLETLHLFIEVLSVVPKGDPMSDVRDIKGPVALKGIFLGGWFLMGGCLLAALLVGSLFMLRRKKAPRPALGPLPHVVALEALGKIEAMGLEQRNIREYYFLVSGVLRRYLEDRFGLRAPEQTTEEFLESVVTNHVLNSAQKELLKSFLEHCDLVKFAKYRPGAEEIATASQTVREFIHQTKPAD